MTWLNYYRFLYYESPHDKTNKMTFASREDICPVWSESSLSAWRNIGSTATNERTVKQTGGCPGWSESSLSVQITLLVLSWGSSYINWSEYQSTLTLCEPPHDKTNKMSVRLAKTQISLGIRPVWSESSLCAQWVAKDPSFLHADSEDSDQTGRMPRLIWVFAGHTCHFGDFVMRWLMSYLFPNIGSPWPMW